MVIYEHTTIPEWLSDGDFLDCNCRSADSELVERGDDKFQVVCGCGVSGPIGSKRSAMHEWNIIQTACRTHFSAYEVINIHLIGVCRDKGSAFEKNFHEAFWLSREHGDEEMAERLRQWSIGKEQE